MLGFWCPALHRSSSRLVKALKFQKWPCQGHVWHSSTSRLASPLTHIGTCLDMSGQFSNRSKHIWNMPWTCLSDHAWTCLENKEIRSILEYGAIVFHHGLTLSLSNLIESVQRNFVKMLSNYVGQDFSWMEGSIFFCIEPMSLRRVTLCETFIKKTLKS